MRYGIIRGQKVSERKWVCTIKGDPEKPIYNACYVAKGYSQIYGTDYFETFAPTARVELEF